MESKQGTSSLGNSECNEDSGITMLDVLEEEKELEDDANAVLGGSDDQNCTYIQGYVKRQALYACGTCVTSDMEPAGICLACSYACHEGHNLYELYTKRNFRCDCGNSKLPKNSCRLWKSKSSVNVQNNYNANFQGKYCTCARPYPDPEDDISDEMIQCIMCEDWFHGRHLGGPVPDGQDYSEMICTLCMSKHPFLWRYQIFSKEVLHLVKEDSTTNLSLEEPEENPFEEANKSNSSTTCLDSVHSKPTTLHNSEKESKSVTEPASVECLLNCLPDIKDIQKGPTFWPEGWRKKLCKCQLCLDHYEALKCLFLLEEEDTVHAYEEQGKAKQSGQSQYDKGMSALNTLDRVQQVEAIHEYNNMKSELKEYLKKFADSKKVVREEDILEFFSTMQAKKKQRVDNYQMPHFCR